MTPAVATATPNSNDICSNVNTVAEAAKVSAITVGPARPSSVGKVDMTICRVWIVTQITRHANGKAGSPILLDTIGD
ncbi:hypothetical protein FBU30_007441 [Linnemannia zychae]|nr:hypothetical protein FBU30_007441 [Linnemannia zychae]